MRNAYWERLEKLQRDGTGLSVKSFRKRNPHLGVRDFITCK